MRVDKVLNTIVNDDCVKFMRRLDAGCVHLVNTSCPFDYIRRFDGNKWDWQVFQNVVRGLQRIVVEGGIVCWEVGNQIVERGETNTAETMVAYFDAMGWNKINEIAINNPYQNGSGEQQRRYGRTLTRVYVFCRKGEKHRAFNPIKDKPNVDAGKQTNCSARMSNGRHREPIRVTIAQMRMRNNVWPVITGKHCGEEKWLWQRDKNDVKGHEALQSEQLAHDLIYSYSNAGDVVFDPFCGAGTTCKRALMLGRNYIGTEIVAKYFKMAQRRVRETTKKLANGHYEKPRNRKWLYEYAPDEMIRREQERALTKLGKLCRGDQEIGQAIRAIKKRLAEK